MTSLADLVVWWPRSEPVLARAATGDCEDLAAIHAASFHRGWGAEDLAAMLRDPAIVAHVVRRRAGGPPPPGAPLGGGGGGGRPPEASSSAASRRTRRRSSRLRPRRGCAAEAMADGWSQPTCLT